jgi:small GTP-binding protein
MGLLSKEERELLGEQKSLVKRAREVAAQVGAVNVQEYTGTFLDDLVDETTFSVVVAGEFNAGKSTLINALLGKKVLEAGALPTTDSITILTKSSSSSSGHEEDSVEKHNVTNSGGGVIIHHVSKKVPLLDDLTFIDTPGTNAVLADHTARTLKLLPTADLILFVTSADRPFPESERALLSSIQNYRKSIVIIVNKMDILEASGGSFGEDEKKNVVDFVTDHAASLLGARPMVIPVSSRDALSAKVTGQVYGEKKNSVWERSNFAALESFLKDSLTMETKIKFKLTNPIGQAEGLVSASLVALKQEREELELDIATIKLLQSQYAAWKKEMEAEVDRFHSDVSSLMQTEARRVEVLIERLGLFQFYQSTLLDTSGLETEFSNTRPNFSSRQTLKGDLLEFVQETA